MSSKLIVLSAFLAIARAGNFYATGPAAVAYETPAAVAAIPHLPYAYAAAASPLAVQLHTPAVGSSHQSTLRSLDGNSAISHYSKSVDTAFSSVRKVDTRITNDAKILTPATLTYASAPIVKTAPVLSYPSAEHLTYAAYAAPAPATHVVSHTSFNGIGAAYAF